MKLCVCVCAKKNNKNGRQTAKRALRLQSLSEMMMMMMLGRSNSSWKMITMMAESYSQQSKRKIEGKQAEKQNAKDVPEQMKP